MTAEVLPPREGSAGGDDVDVYARETVEFLSHPPGETDILPCLAAAVKRIESILCKIPPIRRLK